MHQSTSPAQMPRLHTPLTALLDIDSPVVCPPMAGAAGGSLAAQVTLAGGFGFANPGQADATAFARELDIARSILSSPPGSPLAIGAGYLGWMLDAGGNAIETLRVALEQRVKCVWFSFGADLGKWVAHVRQYDQMRDTPHRTLIWILVNSVAEAEQATKEWKADVLVVQGIEAGGHGHSQALPLLSLLPLVKSSIPELPPLVAAGGLADGAHVAAVLVLGASGAALGTRFLLTPECTYSSNQKQALLAAVDTVRTLAFDEVRSSMGWPQGVDGRALWNKTVEDKTIGRDLEERQKLFLEATKKDDTSRSATWAGASIGLMNEIKGAGDVVNSIQAKIVMCLDQASVILGRH